MLAAVRESRSADKPPIRPAIIIGGIVIAVKRIIMIKKKTNQVRYYGPDFFGGPRALLYCSFSPCIPCGDTTRVISSPGPYVKRSRVVVASSSRRRRGRLRVVGSAQKAVIQ